MFQMAIVELSESLGGAGGPPIKAAEDMKLTDNTTLASAAPQPQLQPLCPTSRPTPETAPSPLKTYLSADVGFTPVTETTGGERLRRYLSDPMEAMAPNDPEACCLESRGPRISDDGPAMM